MATTLAYKKIVSHRHSFNVTDRERKDSTNQRQENEVKVAQNGRKVNSLTSAPMSVPSEHVARLTRLKKYIAQVNLNFRPLKLSSKQSIPVVADSDGYGNQQPIPVVSDSDRCGNNTREERKRKKPERRPSFTDRLFKRFSSKQRTYSESDLARCVIFDKFSIV